MNWYKGNIGEAITVSKQKNAIFVVYIEGKNEQSTAITALINAQSVKEVLESQHFVAIKIDGESEFYQQFSEIYKQPPVPSMYFIGKTGQPLEIITEVKDSDDLVGKIRNVLTKADVNTSSVSAAATSASLIETEQKPEVTCEDGVCTLKKPEPSAEEKLQRAKDLVEKQRDLKQREEEEKERQKEIERRKMGQNVQQMKRWQEDQELKQLKEEREKEKKEQQAARDRVLAQIAQDKAERASKFSGASPPKEAPSSVTPPKPQINSNVARLQFKLPDGTSHTNEFPSGDHLQIVVDYIKANLNLGFSSFTLSTTFPRREFSVNDYSQSLADLQLVPNAVVLVLPLNHGAVQTNQGGGGLSMVNNFLWSLFAPIFGILGYLKGLLSGGGAEEGASGGGQTTSGKRPAGGSSSYGGGAKGGSVVQIRSKYDLDSKLKAAGNRLVVIDFFATWCGPCRHIAPKMEELAREFPNVLFLKVDVDENRDISSSYGVSAMPTFAFVKNRRTITKFSGADYYQLRETVLKYK